jgi:antitoxin (DNA-binding transcriptional repressor) of toxin-antitoxin stability system
MAAITIDIGTLPEAVRNAIEKAALGDEINFTKDGIPTVRLTKLKPRRQFILGLHPGAMVMREDFNDPIDEEAFLRGDM